MNKKICGIIGLILGIFAVLSATWVIYARSPLSGIGYLVVSAIAGIAISYFFCRRCPIRKKCVHILPGIIAGFWPEKSGPYSSFEILVTVFLFALIILPPQIWLINNIYYLAFFWICLIMAGICSTLFLCPDCGNRHCPFCRR